MHDINHGYSLSFLLKKKPSKYQLKLHSHAVRPCSFSKDICLSVSWQVSICLQLGSVRVRGTSQSSLKLSPEHIMADQLFLKLWSFPLPSIDPWGGSIFWADHLLSIHLFFSFFCSSPGSRFFSWTYALWIPWTMNFNWLALSWFNAWHLQEFSLFFFVLENL